MSNPDFSHSRMHILGHPDLPLDPDAFPENAQILNCWNFCLLMEHLGIPYCYYGPAGSRLPEGTALGTAVSCGKPTGRWKYRNAWHRLYSRRISRCLKQHLAGDGRMEWAASLYGIAHSDILFPRPMPVFEPMVGYDHCWTRCRVFPSYAQQHILYARQPEYTGPTRFFDTVIPHFLDPGLFHSQAVPGKYLLYLGRDSSAKGIEIARRCAAESGLELKCVHHGCRGQAKADLLTGAYAVMMPTLYMEPFGYVAAEAQICGTPVICTDWGAFTETVIQGVTGYRCRTHAEFMQAIARCPGLDRTKIRKIAEKRFTVAAVAEKYSEYLDLLWKVQNCKGYYTEDAVMERKTFMENNFSIEK